MIKIAQNIQIWLKKGIPLYEYVQYDTKPF